MSPPLSQHLALEVAAVRHRGRPLDPGAPVPGCGCARCTGIPASEVRRRPRRRARRDLRPALDVDAARAAPILEVAAMLGIEHRHGWALCPFHDDRDPSLHLNATKNRAFCNPCGRSWDPISLLMALRGCGFVDAVRELAAGSGG